MDDTNAFDNFLQNVVGVTVPHARNAILDFIPTLSDLLALSDDEIASFVATIHASNSARANNAKVLISPQVTVSLQALLFELKDRELCGALPTLAEINMITIADLAFLRKSRNAALQHNKRRKEASASKEMTVPKFHGHNYDEFISAFKSLASRHVGVNGLPLDYLMRDNPPGDFFAVWNSREEKLVNCVIFQGDNFRTDREAVYSLFVQHIGTTGPGSTFVNKYERSRNGYACYCDIKSHYANATYLQNKAAAANNTIQNAHYNGQRNRFTIETYYNIMTNAFNDLNNAGPAYHVSEAQKIVRFEAGLAEDNALKFTIQARATFDALPPNEQTFDRYYNIFSALLNKYHTLAGKTGSHSNTNRRNPSNFIGNMSTSTTSQTGRHGNRGRGSRRGTGGRSVTRGGRGRGRHQHGSAGRSLRGSASNNSFAPTYGNFVPEAKVYNPDVFRNLTIQQK